MSLLSLEGRVAVVTGAGRGIGRAHALLLAARGAKVVVNDLGVDVDGTGPSSGPAEEVVEEIRQAGGTAVASADTVATEEGASAIVDRGLRQFGRVDAIIHNAGLNLGVLDDILDIHVRGAWWLVERAWPGMVERGHGRIVLTTSSSGLFGDGTGPAENPKQAYATAKTAVIGLTKSLAVRGRSAGITVNAVSPTAHTRLGGLNRGMASTRAGGPPPEAALEWMALNAPPELVAAGTLWLVHDDCPVTGRVFNVGAGRVAEIFLGVTRGYVAPDGALTPEGVMAHLAQVSDPAGHHVPIDTADYAQWIRSVVPGRTRA
ncbi:MAG: short-chain dehydrogenase [Actinomycetia bacterium]|nr:short-chain dehydrogenase [Actinomycetes bacterium]